MKRLPLLILSVFTGLFLHAQNVNVIISPKINPDKTIQFQIKAPHAKSVELSGQFSTNNIPLIKGDQGIWSVTIPSPKPDIYPYNFVVDGTPVSDPCNKLIFPNENFKASLLEIPDVDALYTVNNVPHGKLHYCTYKSNVLNENRPLVVYTPAEYDKNPNKKYPVFYLVSGTTDTEETWVKAGRVNDIADNLIARNQAEPMIIVMPYGYMNNGTPRPFTIEAAEMYSTFSDELTKNIIPLVESNYRTRNNRDSRAIAGFSRGGGQSMFTALKNIDKFAWLGSFSAYLTPEVMGKYFPNIVKDANSLKMLWFGVGKSDFLYDYVIKNQKYFDSKGINYEKVEREGSHTWMHARFCLAETLQKLFKDSSIDKKYPYMVIDNSSTPGFTVYKPSDMKGIVAKQGRLPIFVFGNGACSHDSSYYIPMFASMVKSGYIVIAVGDNENKPDSGNHDMSTIGKDDNLLDAVDWISKESVKPWSDLCNNVDIFNIAVGGHSCGGAQAMSVSYDPRIKSTIMFNSGLGDIEMAGASTRNLKDLHNPIIYLIGGPEDIAYKNAALDYQRIDKVPAVSVNYNVGHGGTYGQEDGGVVGKVALLWLDWNLKGKKEASKYFFYKKFRDKNYPGAVFESKGLKK